MSDASMLDEAAPSSRSLRSTHGTAAPLTPATLSASAPSAVAHGAQPRRAAVVASLAIVYVVWGSTFLAIRVALDVFPPLLMAGLRFTAAGAVLFAIAKARGAATPTGRQWAACAAVGVLFVGSNAAVVFGEQTVATGVTAMIMATIPTWTALFAAAIGARPSAREWAGLAMGLTGVAALQIGRDMGSSTAGAVALLAAPIAWALGTVWSRRLPLPAGLMQSAAELLCGGVVLLATAIAHGDHPSGPLSLRACAALGYLIVFGSLVAFSAYGFLVRETRPTVTTSYAYVNPIVAVLLGVLFAGERVTPTSAVAMLVTLGGVALIARRRGG